jgi:hypothetical protein
MVRKVIIALAAVTFAGAMAASTTAGARMGGGGGFRGGGFHGGMGGGFRGGMMGGGFRGAAIGGGFRGVAIGGGFRGAPIGGGFRSAAIGGGFRGAAFRGGFVGSRSFAFRPGFAPRVNRLRSLVSIDSIIAASPSQRCRSPPALVSMAPRAGLGSRRRGAGSESGPVATIMATTKLS